MATDFEYHLLNRWSLRIGPDSKEILNCAEGEWPEEHHLVGWQRREHLHFLGGSVSHDGGVEAGYTALKASLAAAYWGNCGHKMRRYLHTRMRTFQRCALGIVMSRVVSWPWTRPRARRLDDLQLYWLCRAHGAAQQGGETVREAWERVRKVALDQQRKDGKWSAVWAKRQAGYWEHAQRHPHCWPARLGKAVSAKWIQQRRTQNAAGSTRGRTFHSGAGRTRTRAAKGRCVQRRWSEGLEDVMREQRAQADAAAQAGVTAGGYFAAQRRRAAEEAAAANQPCPACSMRYRCAHDCPAPTQPREAEPENGLFEDFRQSVVDGWQWIGEVRDTAREAVGGLLRDWAVDRW